MKLLCENQLVGLGEGVGVFRNLYEVKATSMWVAPETYIVNERAEAEELAMELRARQYKVEVSEIESED